jgi:stage V sporulation protein SpoVS
MTWQRDLFEGHELAAVSADQPDDVLGALADILREEAVAADLGAWSRRRAIKLFGIETVGPQWREFLG